MEGEDFPGYLVAYLNMHGRMQCMSLRKAFNPGRSQRLLPSWFSKVISDAGEGIKGGL
jgi:hypothetical protein